jgi:hypothetical protein
MHPKTNGRPVARSDAGGAALKTAAGALGNVEPLLLNRVDAARLLSISPRKFDQWVNAGLISKWSFSGVVRFELDGLRAFVANQRPKPTAGDGRRPSTPTLQLRNGVDAPPV